MTYNFYWLADTAELAETLKNDGWRISEPIKKENGTFWKCLITGIEDKDFLKNKYGI